MKRGPKPKGERIGMRTLLRHDVTDDLHGGAAGGANPPVMPDYIANIETADPARAVWMENIERVTANGATERDSDLFARYCVMEAGFRAISTQWMAGEDGNKGPPAALVEHLRKVAEQLGIAGPGSRDRLKLKPAAIDNGFFRNGVQR